MRFAVGLFILFLLGASIAGVPLGASGAETGAYTGAAIPVPVQVESQLADEMRDFLQGSGYSYPGHLFVMAGANGGVYVVASTSDVEPGVATVRGERLATPDGDKYGVIVAQDVSIDQTPSATLTAREYNQTRDQYVGEIVEIDGHYRQTASIGEADGFVSQDQLGTIATAAPDIAISTEPGQTARGSLLSTASGNGSRYADALTRVALFHGEVVAVPRGYRQSAWWMSANASVRVLVLPESLKSWGWNSNEHIIESDVESTRTVSPATIHTNGEALKQKVVTVRGQAVGTQISTQETLLSVARCAPESVTVPATPPLCVPLPMDMSIHSGAIATADDPTAIVPYVGLSNQHQQTAVTDEQGTYELTGRVVAASELDPRLDGYGLIVYERERIGSLDAPGFTSTLEARAENYTKIYQTQLAMSESEYRKMKRQQDQTPTPTRTVTPSPSPSPTATAAATTTAPKTQTPTATPGSNTADDSTAGIPNTLFDYRWLIGLSDSHPSMVEFLASNRFALLYLPTWLLVIGASGVVLGGGFSLISAKRVLGVPFGRIEAVASGVLVAAVTIGGMGFVAGFVAAPAATVISAVVSVGTIALRLYLRRR